MTTPLLENCRCVRCNNVHLELVKPVDPERVVPDAIACQDCGECYDSIWGVPFWGGFGSNDLLSLIEIASQANKFGQIDLSEADSHEYWEGLLSEYHRTKERSTFLSDRGVRNAEAVVGRLSHRYREWLVIKSLTQDLVLAGKSVLDVGAGSGFDSYRLMGAGGGVTALEANPVLIYEGRKKLPSIRWMGGFSHTMPFGDESFDCVFSNASLHHMRDIPGTISEMLRVLKPGGWMVTTSDPYRADFFGEAYELAVHDQNPSVLGGVNERMPPFSEFATVLKSHDDRLDIHVFTHGLIAPLPLQRGSGFGPGQALVDHLHLFSRLQSFVSQSGNSLDDILGWDFQKDHHLLSETFGTIAFKVRKNGSIHSNAPLQLEQSLRVANLVQWLESREENKVVGRIARFVPEKWVNLPFLKARHSKFLLLNGWRSNHAHPKMRQAYRRGRWFFRRSEGQTSLEIEALLPGPSEAPPAIFEVFIDGRNVFSQEVSRGVWIVLGFQLTSLPTTEPFATELHVRGTEEQSRENLIWVRKLELGTS